MNTQPTATHLSHPTGHRWISFLAHFLFVLVAWTVFIKYLFPMGYSLFYGESLSRYIYWDLWPLGHVWMGWALLARPRYTRALAIVMSVIEIGIIVTFFVWFLSEPEWSIWRTNWFINKVFVLGCFVLLLLTAIASPQRFVHSSSDEKL